MIEKEFRIVYYDNLPGYFDGDYDVGTYFDSYTDAKIEAGTIRKSGQRCLIEVQEVEMENGEAVDHYGWSQIPG